jgi:putrescine:ornithine antiporter
MFSPAIGSIIMALAILACLGSLLGWQFTISRTAKSAADDRLFPTIFSRENSLGAPVAGMIIMGIVQTAMALSTISPTLSQQFSALVNLAVVTNVIPYIISLSALFVMMKSAGVSEAVVRRNTWITVVAMLYSTYAIYASGKDAVLGGTIVLALTYILYGFLAPRFSGGAAGQAGVRSPARAAGAVAAAVAIMLAFVAATLLPSPAHAQAAAKKEVPATEAAKKSGKLTLGYYANARPFAYTDESGKPAGYAVELCQLVAGAASVETAWVAVKPEDRVAALRDGKVNLVCGEPDRLSARKDMAFSIPIFQGGIGALLRKDAPPALSQTLSERPGASGPTWRGTPTQQLLQGQTFAVVAGTPGEKLLAERLKEFQLTAKVAPVKDFAEGVQVVLDRKASVFFSDRSMLLDAARRLDKAGDLTVLERRFTLAPLALALRRGDEDGRLAVDRALSRAYGTPEFRAVYTKWFGEPDESAAAFFRAVALPE